MITTSFAFFSFSLLRSCLTADVANPRDANGKVDEEDARGFESLVRSILGAVEGVFGDVEGPLGIGSYSISASHSVLWNNTAWDALMMMIYSAIASSAA